SDGLERTFWRAILPYLFVEDLPGLGMDTLGNCWRKRLATSPNSLGIVRQCSIRVAADRRAFPPLARQVTQAASAATGSNMARIRASESGATSSSTCRKMSASSKTLVCFDCSDVTALAS